MSHHNLKIQCDFEFRQMFISFMALVVHIQWKRGKLYAIDSLLLNDINDQKII